MKNRVDEMEVEITGPLSAEQRDLLRHLETGSVRTQRRFLINFSTPELEQRGIDVRSRITDGKVELIVKRGEWGGGKRSEYPVACADREFVALVRALVAMGLTRGVGAARISRRTMLHDIEVATIEVPGYSFFYEAELVVPAAQADAAYARLVTWAGSLGLTVFDKAAYLAFIADLDQNANHILQFDLPDTFARLEELLESQGFLNAAYPNTAD